MTKAWRVGVGVGIFDVDSDALVHEHKSFRYSSICGCDINKKQDEKKAVH